MQQVQIIGFKLVDDKVYKITVKMKETAGTPCITVNWDKLCTLEWSAKWLAWAVKPISQLLSRLGLNMEKLQGLDGKFGSGKATGEDLV